MSVEEDLKEPALGDWLELANGGGVMFRGPAAPLPLQPTRYTRRRKQLPLGTDDHVEH